MALPNSSSVKCNDLLTESNEDEENVLVYIKGAVNDNGILRNRAESGFCYVNITGCRIFTSI